MLTVDELRDYQLLYEGGRPMYFHFHYWIFRKEIEFQGHPWLPDGFHCVGLYRNEQATWYILSRDGVTEFRAIAEKFLMDPTRLARMMSFLSDHRDKFVEYFTERKFSEVTTRQLADAAEYYHLHIGQIYFVSTTLRMIDRAFVNEIRAHEPDAAKGDELIRLSTVSEEPSTALKEEMALLSLAQKLNEHKEASDTEEVQRGLQEIYDQFRWISAGYHNEQPKSLADYQRWLTELRSQDVPQRQQAIHERQRRDALQQQVIVKTLPPSLQALAQLTAASTSAKDTYKFTVNEMIGRSQPLFEEIARRTGKPPAFLKNLTPDELVATVIGDPIDETLVDERVAHSVLWLVGTTMGTLVGAAADDFETTYIPHDSHSTGELTGRSASPGKVTGTARVVRGTKDFGKMNQGDILVAVNTTPDYVPIMRLAAAIVAEEGGITSHTSVVSRELGIPAVVGVVNATKRLADGDRVEVDAVKGIIKKL